MTAANVIVEASPTGWEAIQAAEGFGIAVTGTLIVFSALTAICLFIGLLPRVLTALGPWLPEIESHHDQTGSPTAGLTTEPTAGPTAGGDARLAAALGWAVHHHRQA